MTQRRLTCFYRVENMSGTSAVWSKHSIISFKSSAVFIIPSVSMLQHWGHSVRLLSPSCNYKTLSLINPAARGYCHFCYPTASLPLSRLCFEGFRYKSFFSGFGAQADLTFEKEKTLLNQKQQTMKSCGSGEQLGNKVSPASSYCIHGCT